jgi:hypothetical protein
VVLGRPQRCPSTPADGPSAGRAPQPCQGLHIACRFPLYAIPIGLVWSTDSLTRCERSTPWLPLRSRSQGGELADHLILARASRAGALPVLSFDQRFAARAGVQLLPRAHGGG